MSRQTSQSFRCHPIAELTRQLLIAPASIRPTQVRHAEALHDDLEPDRNYPFDFISYHITGYRSDATPPMLLTGEAVMADLRLLIDKLTHATPMPVTDDDPVQSPESLAERLNISTKTVSRWRGQGLRWRWVAQPGHKHKVIAFTPQAVEAFLRRHPQRVARASDRTRIDPRTRQQVIERARRIVQAKDASLNQVALHLAKKIGRAHQTIRLLLEHHDRDNPQDKIFIDRTAPLDARQQRRIAHLHKSGVPMSQIASHFNRTRSTIYRSMRHRRVAVIDRLRLDGVASPRFEQDDADRLLAVSGGDTQQPAMRAGASVPVDDLPPEIQPLFNAPRADPDWLGLLLTRYNYLKHRAATARTSLNRYDPRVADLDQIEADARAAAATRDRVVAASLPAVLSAVRRHLVSQPDHSPAHILDLLVASVPTLVEAIDRYDINRAQPFDHYLTYLLMRQFAVDDSPDPDAPGRARRRADGPEALKRLRDAAARHGVRLPAAQ